MHKFNINGKKILKSAFTLFIPLELIFLNGCSEQKRTPVIVDYSSPSSVLSAMESRNSAYSNGDTADADELGSLDVFDPSTAIRSSEIIVTDDELSTVAESMQVQYNTQTGLSVPTYVTEIDGLYFIVDCYHNQIIYSDSLDTYLPSWCVLTDSVTQAHTIASDGDVYLVDDTENNRVLVFEKYDGKFINTQVFNDIGTRPHYTIYDEWTDTFYTWSSTTGELYCFRHGTDDTQMYLSEIRSIESLNGTYVRSFTIVGDYIYFVSGVSSTGLAPTILCCELETLNVLAEYSVPDSLAGMIQITPIQDYFYITISTDITGSQDAATIIRTTNLNNLTTGDYEDIYSTYFVGGGTPYYISNVGDTYYLTEHRLSDHAVWSFNVADNEITNVTAIY